MFVSFRTDIFLDHLQFRHEKIFIYRGFCFSKFIFFLSDFLHKFFLIFRRFVTVDQFCVVLLLFGFFRHICEIYWIFNVWQFVEERHWYGGILIELVFWGICVIGGREAGLI